jgi:hypothetical protein
MLLHLEGKGETWLKDTNFISPHIVNSCVQLLKHMSWKPNIFIFQPLIHLWVFRNIQGSALFCLVWRFWGYMATPWEALEFIYRLTTSDLLCVFIILLKGHAYSMYWCFSFGWILQLFPQVDITSLYIYAFSNHWCMVLLSSLCLVVLLNSTLMKIHSVSLWLTLKCIKDPQFAKFELISISCWYLLYS